jgi:O-Antigen ligase/Tetratricopeptide repeat
VQQRTEYTVVAAAFVVVLTAVLGGGFLPWPRMLIGGLLVALWALAAVEWSAAPARDEVAVGGLILWGVVSAVWVGAAPLASKETLTTWAIAWALWCVTRRGSLGSRRTAFRILIVGGAAVAISVVLAALTTRGIRVGGLLDNPNVAAALLVPTIPLGMIVFQDNPRWRRWIWFLVMGAGIVLTGSRAGLLATVVVVGVLLSRGRIRFVGMLAGAFFAVGVVTWRFISQPDVLAWHRPSIWWATLKIWATRPLTGVGPGSLVEAAGAERILHPEQVGRYQFVIGLSESTPLAILVQLGVVGLLLAALAVGSWWLCVRPSGALDSTKFRAALAGIATFCLFHDFLTTDPVLWWWAVVIGCFEGMARHRAECISAAPPMGVRFAAALAMVWLTAWGLMGPALARWMSPGGEISTAHVERVLRVEPWYPKPAARRVRGLLTQADPWSWETAAEALAWARYALDVQPGLARRWADLGQVHIRVLTDLGGTDHDVAAARRALERACRLDPHLPWHWLERARLERILGFHDEAAGLTRRALQEEPNTVRAWLMLGRLELEQGRVAEARAALIEAMTRAELVGRSGLTAYEMELLEAPQNQIEFLQNALSGSRTETP